MKWDPSGKQLWSRGFGMVGYDSARALAVAKDGTVSVYVVGDIYGGMVDGQSTAGRGNEMDALVLSFTNDGTLNWGRQFGSDKTDTLRQVAVDDAGDVFALGVSERTVGDGFAKPGIDEDPLAARRRRAGLLAVRCLRRG